MVEATRPRALRLRPSLRSPAAAEFGSISAAGHFVGSVTAWHPAADRW